MGRKVRRRTGKKRATPRKRRRKKKKHTFDFPKKGGYSYQATIYVPSTTRGQKPISQEKFHRRIGETRDMLTKKFKGSTTVSGRGSWKDGRKKIEEDVALVSVSTTPEDYRKHDQDLKKYLKKKKREWGQKSVGYEFESPERGEELHFV